MKEIWCDIKGYEGIYHVSNFGRIRNIKGKIIKQQINKAGYFYVCLHYNKQRKYYTVHRLMAIAFLPNPENKKFVIHIDHNKQNNRISNLKWMDESTNKPKKPVYQFDRHGNLIGKYKSSIQAAKQTGISVANIRCCANGITKTAYHNIWLFEDDLDKLADKIKSVNQHRYNEQGKKVNQYDLDGNYIRTYLSQSEVVRINDFDQSAISGCCRGKYKQAYGYIWKYAE
jgi:hypothetical protein